MEWLSSARSKRAALLALLAACHDGGPSAPASNTVSVAVTGYVERSSTVTLAASRGATVLPANSVQWSVAPASLGVLHAGQTLQLVDTGTLTISAKVGDTTATKTLHVGAPPTIVFDMIDVNGSQTRTVFSMTLDGLSVTRLASDSSENFRPTSSGGMVAYTSYRYGEPFIFAVPLTGGTETSLDSLPYPSMEPALSADGRHLAFVTPVSGNNKIWTSTNTGTNAAPVTSGLGPASVDEENPTWSPAGDALVFVTTQYGNAELVELTLATSKETPLGDGTTTDVDPAWSPDGKTLAFASTRDGDVGIFLYTFASGSVTRLSPKPANDGEPAWLPDGRIMYTSWINPSVPALLWIDPAHPSVIHAIPTLAGSAPAHPGAVQER
jgi:Tol biopolymer transport system component